MADAIGIENRRGKLSEILNYVSKFAFESTVVHSLRIASGRKLEVPKNEPSSVPSQHLKIITEEIQAKIEKMQDEMNRTRQHRMRSENCREKAESLKKISDEARIEKMQEEMSKLMLPCKTSTKCVDQFSSFEKKSEENGMKGLDLLQQNKKRVFIRSRM